MIKKMSDEEYFSLDRLSNSYLNIFDRSPAHAEQGITKTKSMSFGSMVHNYILDKEEFEKNYIVAPESAGTNRTLKAFKDFKKTTDKEIIFQKDIETLDVIQENINKLTLDDIDLSEYKTIDEIAILFEYEQLKFKCKLDMLYEGFGTYTIFDIKTCDNAKDFEKSIRNYKYYRQAFLYMKALSIEKGILMADIRFIFVVVESKSPYGAILYELTHDYIALGEYETNKSIEKYKEWQDRGRDGKEIYKNELIKISPDRWQIEKMELNL